MRVRMDLLAQARPGDRTAGKNGGQFMFRMLGAALVLWLCFHGAALTTGLMAR
jgi:hypothetical protein